MIALVFLSTWAVLGLTIKQNEAVWVAELIHAAPGFGEITAYLIVGVTFPWNYQAGLLLELFFVQPAL